MSQITTVAPSAQAQYLRRCSLVVGSQTQATDLSALRIRFSVQQRTAQTPNNAQIRVYNLSKATSQAIVDKEYTDVLLQGGYQSAQFATVFSGTIKQIRRGRESSIRDYVELLCADGDAGYNFATVSVSYAAGMTPLQQIKTLLAALLPFGVGAGYIPQFDGPALPRGKVLHGMVRDVLRDLSQTTGTSWSIQNGKLVMVPDDSYLPGDAVVLNAQTGMIGIPEQQVGGIGVRCLLNPKIVVGTLLQIDNSSITTTLFQNPRQDDSTAGLSVGESFNSFAPVVLPSLASDGFYRTLAINHVGDTWGQEWYSDITCIARDGLLPPGASAQSLAGAATPQGVPGNTGAS